MAMQITPAMLAGPAMAPPPGVIPNLVDPWSCGNVLVGLGGALCGVMIIFVAIRLILKFFVQVRYPTWDDVTCVIGMLLALVYYGMSIVAVQQVGYGAHQWDVSLGTFIGDTSSIVEYLAIVIAPIALGFIKITFFILYLHLFKPLKGLRVAIWIGLVFTAFFYTLATILSFIAGTPRPGETWIEHFEFSPSMKIETTASIWLPAVGIVVDLYILVLPLYAVSRLQLSRKRKLQVASVFMTGIIAVVASILSLAFRIHIYLYPLDDLTYNLVFPLITSIIEQTLGVIVTCAPAFSKMLQHVQPGFTSLRSRLTGSRFTGTRGTSGSTKQKSSSFDNSYSEHKVYGPKVDYVGSNSSNGIDMQPLVSNTPHNMVYAGDNSNTASARFIRVDGSKAPHNVTAGIHKQHDIKVESQGRRPGEIV